jgi:hypothetical protein
MRYLPLILLLPSLAFAASSIVAAKTPSKKAAYQSDRAICEQRQRDAMNAQKAAVGHPGKVKPAGGVYEACMRAKKHQP